MKLPIEKNNIYTFKSTTGEEFIARVKSTGNDYIVIDQPIQTVLNQAGLQMVPSLFSSDADKPVTINTSTISMVATARQDVELSYIEATSGVATAKTIETGQKSPILHG
jgi:ActR/RegA family two-component response regulator